ncbi:MAG: ATP-grasp domain-containing protein [Acetobacteraceae bacterium]
MLLTEADGKALLREADIPTPPGQLVRAPATPSVPGPWMVKAQMPAGGRGLAGLIRRAETPQAARAAVAALLGATHRGHRVGACLIEQVAQGEEQYLAIALDPAAYGLRLLYRAEGGVAVEGGGSLAGTALPPEPAAIAAALPWSLPAAVAPVAMRLAELVLTRELALAEINPLFVSAAGAVAGDARIVIDLNALPRQPALAARIAADPDAYADAIRRQEHGFDYVTLDPAGRIGLLTTGAGLSMMLIDEMTAAGARPLNFCDIRTSMLRGSPARIIAALGWMAAAPELRAILVNIFAGITDLAEFAGLLAEALAARPVAVPVIARLVGRNAGPAAAILTARAPLVVLEPDLTRALARAVEAAR